MPNLFELFLYLDDSFFQIHGVLGLANDMRGHFSSYTPFLLSGPDGPIVEGLVSSLSSSALQDVQIAASGNNVYVSWSERNAISNEPVFRVSNDNCKTFGEKIMLSTK
jgi:hypothetical protein